MNYVLFWIGLYDSCLCVSISLVIIIIIVQGISFRVKTNNHL